MNNLRDRIRIAGFLGGALSCAGAVHAWGDGDSLRGNDTFIDFAQPAGPFHPVVVQSGIRVELRVGAPSISVHAEENTASIVLTEIDGGVLRVRFANHSSHSDNGVTVKVSAPAIDMP